MKKAYILLVHKNPEQLYRLIKRLDDNNSTFFIHIDKKIPIDRFGGLKNFGNKIQIVERTKSGWGTFGLVESTITLLRAVVAYNQPFEMINFLSGQDYPIKSNEFIDDFFASSPQSIFLSYFSLPNFERWEKDGGMWRANKYFFGLNKGQLLTSKALNFTSSFLPFLRRVPPQNMQLYLGSQWFSISLEAIKYILTFIDENPWYISYHTKSFGADEMFFLMILLNSSDDHIQSNISNDNLRFMKWKTYSIASPDTLTKDDFDSIQNSEALFARKFDVNVDSDILDRIDSEILTSKPAILSM